MKPRLIGNCGHCGQTCYLNAVGCVKVHRDDSGEICGGTRKPPVYGTTHEPDATVGETAGRR